MDAPRIESELRSKVWWLLSRFFVERPDAGFLDELRTLFDPHLEPSSDHERTLTACLHASDSSLAARLAVELTRLFRGIGERYGPPPPYESLYRGDCRMGEYADAVRRHYVAAGLDALVPETALPDHLATELRFLALLSLRESEAWAAGREDLASAAIERQTDFLDRHLLVWLPAYVKRIAAESREPFYTAAVGLAGSFAEDARRDLDLFAAELRDALNPREAWGMING